MESTSGGLTVVDELKGGEHRWANCDLVGVATAFLDVDEDGKIDMGTTSPAALGSRIRRPTSASVPGGASA
jgi:hypothetical protein